MSGCMSTEQKILAWAEWSRQQNPIRALGYKSPSQALIEQHMGGGIPLPNMSDDEALKIDAAVMRLKIKQPELHRAFLGYYLYRKSQRVLAKEFGGMSQPYLRSWVQQAVSWIDGQLDAANSS
jgi:hypothetical protein